MVYNSNLSTLHSLRDGYGLLKIKPIHSLTMETLYIQIINIKNRNIYLTLNYESSKISSSHIGSLQERKNPTLRSKLILEYYNSWRLF